MHILLMTVMWYYGIINVFIGNNPNEDVDVSSSRGKTAS